MQKEFNMEEELIKLIKDASREISALKVRFDQCDKDRVALSLEVTHLKKQQGIDQKQIELCLEQIEILKSKIA